MFSGSSRNSTQCASHPDILGIANNKQVKAETSGDDYATIFMDMVNKSRNSLIKLVQFMLLIENNNMNSPEDYI